MFTFFLENNQARRAAARGDDLREVIMRPVDTDAIKAEISQIEAKKRDLDDQLPDLEQQRTQLEDRIEDQVTAIST